MTYPATKDTFRRVENYVSGDPLPVNKLDEDDQNNMADTVEGIQDALGTNPQGGEVDVKTRIANLETGKVNKSGDTMSGDLDLDVNFLKFDGDDFKMKYQADHSGLRLLSSHSRPNISSDIGLYFAANAGPTGGGSWEPYLYLNEDGTIGLAAQVDKHINLYGAELLPQPDDAMALGKTDRRFTEAHVMGDIEIYDNTKGIILNSATKRWRVTIDDTGTLQTTQL